MPDLSLGAIARGQYAEGLKEAVKIIEARLPLYTDIGQINALRECLSSIKGALKEKRELASHARNADVHFRGKPIDELTREEAIEALHRLLEHTDRPRPFDV